ncbi:MAG: DEAD/DEAH box helicase family protein [Bacteroidetes bacterium]|nr:DEAD/DEAH box helicase family protein [Bacteroidota bacterium]
MNEAETRAELIDPKLKENGWDSKANPDVKVHREYTITQGKIKASGGRGKALIADYVLAYKSRKLAVVEAKSDEQEVGEGVAQAKNYAEKLGLDHTYAANGKEIYYINMDTALEASVENFHEPLELWNEVFPEQNEWQDKYNSVPFEDKGGTMGGRFYQDIAIEKVLDAVSEKKPRILLTLATGTGKTFIAFQIAWKLFHSRWNLQYDGKRRPRILFLADRNILADQAFNVFSSFPEDALVRIRPHEIKKKGSVPTNGSIFFTIFQTFMSGPNDTPYFGEYPKDFFDFIIIDECHRGGANNESTWREIMNYFSPAVQIGLTATPKRTENVDTYEYFGDPVYIYSLKEGINDGFLTPFKVKRIKTSLDEYTYESDDKIIEGEIEEGKTYTESDFNRIIEIKAREEKRVRLFLDSINQNEKTIIFCATQDHAAAVRDLINQFKKSNEPNYCVRVTANDGELGEQYLREFQDNEKTIPTILTTSQKLSTGVDARNIRNIVLMRPVNSIVEFKQIVGRGTRLFDGKNFFTIYDFVNASERFKDPEWDGEPVEPEPCFKCGKYPCECEYEPPKPCPDCGKIPPCWCIKEPPPACQKCGQYPCVCIKKVKIKLGEGKELEIEHTVESTFWGPNGEQLTVEEFLQSLYGSLPDLFKSEDELRFIWANPITRKVLLDKLADAGFGIDELTTLQKLIDADKSDLFDVLEFIAYAVKPISRELRVAAAQKSIFATLDNEQKEFLDFVLSKYIQTGVEELDQDKLPGLLELKYHSISDASERLGSIPDIRNLFIDFQKYLYVGE